MRHIRFVLFALFVITVLPSPASAGVRVSVLIAPFEMHSMEDISAERRALMETLARSLDAAGAEVVGIDLVRELMIGGGVAVVDEETALALASRARAEFVVLGSITRLGRTFNADWRVLDSTTGAYIGFYYKSGADAEALARKIREAAPEVYSTMVRGEKDRPVRAEGALDRVTVVGNRRVDAEAVLKKLTSRPGTEYSHDNVREDMRAVYGMGLFDDVTAELFDTAAGMELRFTVREKPVIRRLAIRGSDKVEEETIREVLALKSNANLDYVTLNEDVERIKALYEGEGFYLASVEGEVIVEDEGASVAYVIEEGEKVQVKSITIIGNEAIGDKKLKKSMRTSVRGFFSFITGSGSFNEFVFRNDLAIIVNEYLNKGYLRADITDHRVLLSEDKRWFHITITVTEGVQFMLGEFDITGDILGTKEELLARFDIERGDVFNRSLVTKGIEAIRDVYGDQGYAFAAFSPISSLDAEKKSVDIMLEISKNDLAYIERIDITGNVKTRDKVIRREIEVVEGDLYSSSGIKRSRGNLRRLGYFEDVTIERSQGSAADRLKLNVTVKEVPTGAFSLGVGYSSFDKLIGTGSVSQSNLFGTGIKASISAMLSSSSTRFTISFTEPWLFDKPLSAGIDIFNVEREYTDFTIDEKGFGLRFGFPIHKRTTRGSLSYKIEDVEVTDIDENASIIIREQEGTRTVSSILASIRRDTRDDAFFPTEGSNASFSIKYAGGPLGGDTDFLKFDTGAIKFFPIPWKNISISQRLSLGYITGLSGQDEPIYERYFLGGINSLRGFESRSVGPRDPVTDEIIGGNVMFVSNTELLFPILSRRTLRGVVFFDIGNSFEDDIDFGDLRMGAGAGVRWFSPMGPLRIELGFNLDRREDEKARLWEFTMGSAF